MNNPFLKLTLIGLAVFLAGCGSNTAIIPSPSPSPVEFAIPSPVNTPTAEPATSTPQPTNSPEASPQVMPMDTAEVTFMKPVALEPESVLSPDKIKKIVAWYNKNTTSPSDQYTWEKQDPKSSDDGMSLRDDYHFYNAGKVKMEPYRDWNLLVLLVMCDGPCGNPPVYRLAQNPKNHDLVLLTKYSPDLSQNEDSELLKIATTNSTFAISALDLPKTLAIPNSKEVLKLKEIDSEYTPDYTDTVSHFTRVLFNSPIGAIYADDSNDAKLGIGCVRVKRVDGSMATYAFDPGLDNPDAQMKLMNGKSISVSENYVTFAGGCGIGSGCYYVRQVNEENLKEYAALSSGLKLFAPIKTDENAESGKGSDDLGLVAGTYREYSPASSNESSPAPKPSSFAEFTATHPVLFWKDPFGRWSAIVSKEFQPAAECGKPVIYLYPEKDTNVSVKVGIETLTKSDPDYGNGWNVLAHVGGLLTNFSDGKNYPYLFWEGNSSKTVAVEKGFSVARDDLSEFLGSTLTKAGLNTQEKKDFTDFWYPRMMQNPEPYFTISFLGTSEFNTIAPLDISPKPDTLARIFMFYRPSWEKENLQPQTINGFARRGFTVVEWGGTSNIPWKS